MSGDDAAARIAARILPRLGPTPVRAAWPSVSVIVPTQDRLELLRSMLGALAHTTEYPGLEVIVVDNASADGTLEWLERTRSRSR